MKSEDLSVENANFSARANQFAERPPALTFEAHQQENVTILRCQGRIVFREEAAVLSRRVTELIDHNQPLVLDLSGVQAIDSAGLGELVLLHVWANSSGYSFRLAAPNDQVCELFEITNLIAVFNVHSTVDEAVYALRRRFARSA